MNELPQEKMARIEAAVRNRLGNQIRDFQVVLQDRCAVLRWLYGLHISGNARFVRHVVARRHNDMYIGVRDGNNIVCSMEKIKAEGNNRNSGGSCWLPPVHKPVRPRTPDCRAA